MVRKYDAPDTEYNNCLCEEEKKNLIFKILYMDALKNSKTIIYDNHCFNNIYRILYYCIHTSGVVDRDASCYTKGPGFES